MSAGYTYTTISAGPGEPVRVGVSFYLDERGVDRGACGRALTGRTWPSRHGDVSVGHRARRLARSAAEDARIARELADQAAAYAAEVERLHAEPAKRHGPRTRRREQAGRQELRSSWPPPVSLPRSGKLRRGARS